MQNNLSEEEQARAAAALAMVQAVQALNNAMAAAARIGVYAKLSIYTPQPLRRVSRGRPVQSAS